MTTRLWAGPLPLALLLTALAPASPARAASSGPPAFLDAGDQVDVRLSRPVAADDVAGHVTVQCGNAVIPVARVEPLPGGVKPAKADPSEVVLAGTFQATLGGTAWQPGGTRTRMRPVGHGVYTFVCRLPRGRYEYKVARGGDWSENYGQGFQKNGANLVLIVPRTSLIRFEVDFVRRTIRNSIEDPEQVPPPTRLLGEEAPAPAGSALTTDLRLHLARWIGPAEIARPTFVRFDGEMPRPVFARDVLSEPAYFYAKDDLGATYTRARTTFKVWSPVTSAADVRLYHTATDAAYRQVPLRRGPAGVWYAAVPGDLDGVYYQYRLISYGARHTAPDIYGHAASADLRRSMVVDLARTDPPGWASAPLPHLRQPTNAVVYELHVRDFTSDPAGGVPPPLRGKYLGLIAPGTHVLGGGATGLDYLRRLGVTDVHLLPIQSINPGHAGGYNWGYETDLFNVPEPRYATNPDDPAGVIRQVKTMVAGLHRARLGVVMDVVYNHTVPVSGDASPFWATVPYYYFRTDFGGNLLNESGVGNALDDAHPMVRRYVRDSLLYWARQYRVDGFRFDLLGMFTPQSVRAWAAALHRRRPDLLLYGEPWTGGGPIRFGKGAQRGTGVAVFNDNFRSAVRGDLNGALAGFALGGGAPAATLDTALAGSPDFAAAPGESMNYVSIHDDMTLLDKVKKALPRADAVTDQRALKLAGAMVLLSQGVPILEGGAEMGRTKAGNSNSYNLGDAVNQFDWARGRSFQPVADYYRGLIAVRRAHPAFRCATAAAVRRTLAFVPLDRLPPETVAFALDGAPAGDRWARTLVVFHGAAEAAPLALPPGRWRVAVDGDRAGLQGAPLTGPTLSLAPLSAYVFYQDARP